MKKIIVITGASSGIGRQFCLKYDNFGADEIWGFALDQDGLDETKKLLKTPFQSFAGDLTNNDVFEQYIQKLNDEKCSVILLINCSGFGKFGNYKEINLDASLNMIELNCKSLVKMTEITLPYMDNGAKIANISSVAAFQPIPFVNVYGATKAFVLSYSRALNIELKPRKISVTCVCPYWTKTNFFSRAIVTENKVVSKYVVMYDADKVVNISKKAIEKRKSLIIPGFISKAQVLLVILLPTKLIMWIWLKQQNLYKKYNL